MTYDEDKMAQAVVEGRAQSISAMRRVIKRLKEGRKDEWKFHKPSSVSV